MSGTITISSSYGANGDSVGHAIAERLGVQFFDRAIPVAVARQLAVEPDEAIAKDWHAPGRMERVLSAMMSSSTQFGLIDPEAEAYSNPDVFRVATEKVIQQIADGEGGVILGRASMVVLKNRPDVLCVRLDGPVEARIRQVVQRGGADEAKARQEQKDTDDARESYGRTFYRVTQNDPSLYHLIIDSTAFSQETCVDLVLRAAEDHLGMMVPRSTD
jgi:cytidylate kinase